MLLQLLSPPHRSIRLPFRAPQVNPLMTVPRIDPRFGVPPQRVSFYSSEGIKMDFVATTVE